MPTRPKTALIIVKAVSDKELVERPVPAELGGMSWAKASGTKRTSANEARRISIMYFVECIMGKSMIFNSQFSLNFQFNNIQTL